MLADNFRKEVVRTSDIPQLPKLPSQGSSNSNVRHLRVHLSAVSVQRVVQLKRPRNAVKRTSNSKFQSKIATLEPTAIWTVQEFMVRATCAQSREKVN